MKRLFKNFFAALLIVPVMTTMALAQSDYRIKSGDVLRVEVLEDSSLNRDAIVLPDGRFSFPLAGAIKASGRSVDQVRREVINKLASNFATEPTVFVSVSRLAEPRFGAEAAAEADKDVIYVLGEVNQPGAHEIEEGTTMLQALAQVGGFSKFAATKRIQLRRTDKSRKERIYSVNYREILQGKTSIGTTVLIPGDVIIVPQRKLFE